MTQARISQIVTQAKKKPDVLSELILQKREKQTSENDLANFIWMAMQGGVVINTAAEVKDLYKSETGEEVKVPEIRRVMRDLLGMRYTKMINSAPQSNVERSRVLRQLCSLKLLQVLRTTKRCINIDETEVDRLDFRRRVWQQKGVSNTMPVKRVRPRVTMIAAMDTHGEVYVSLL